MPDRESVITHLQIISTWASFDLERDLRFFTKKHLEDIERWAKDAIALLKEREARVMKLDELTEIYVEFKDDICPVRLTNFDLQKIIMYAEDGSCRLWTARPTNEQMEAVKWNA